MFQATYYAGVHNMLTKVLNMLRYTDPMQWESNWQRLMDGMVRFSRDYQSGKV